MGVQFSKDLRTDFKTSCAFASFLSSLMSVGFLSLEYGRKTITKLGKEKEQNALTKFNVQRKDLTSFLLLNPSVYHAFTFF